MLEQYPDIMTTEQVAEYLQLTIEEVEELLSSGEIPAKKIGKRWRISKIALITFLGADSQLQPTIPKPVAELIGPSVNKTLSLPQPIAASIQAQPSAQLLENETVIKITATFNAQVQTAKMKIREPDFVCPQDLDLTSQNLWSAAKQSYENAKRVNHLGSQSDRTQPLFLKFNQLHDLNPLNPQVKRHLAYFNYLKNNKKVALQLYKEAAWLSKQAEDWFSVAALAVKDQRELACYSLEQAFLSVSPEPSQTAWYLYIQLVHEFQNYHAITKLVKMSNRGFSLNELKFILKTGIYLLKKSGKEALAINFVPRLSEDKSLITSVREVFKNFPAEPAKSLKSLSLELDSESKKFLEKTSTALSPPSESKKSQQSGKIHNDLPEPGDNVLSMDRSKGTSITLDEEEQFKSAQKYADNGEYNQAIALMRKVLAINPDNSLAQEYRKKWREEARFTGLPIGSNPYARAKQAEVIEKNLEEAVSLYKEAIDSNDNLDSAVKDLATLLANRLGRTGEAIEILQRHRSKVGKPEPIDNLLSMMYEKIGQPAKVIKVTKSTGKSEQIDETITPSDSLSSGISQFAQFFLERCEFRNIPPERVVEVDGKKKYIGSARDIKYDLEQLENFAKEVRTRRPRERAEILLTAAKIIEDREDTDKFFQYLFRSFTSRGDFAVRQHLDVACDLYCEALALHEGVDENKGEEKDVANAIVRLLFSTLGQPSVPLDPNNMPSVEEAIETVFQKHPQPNKVFDIIGYAIVNSHYLAKRVLPCLFQKPTLQAIALDYLKDQKISVAINFSLEELVSFLGKSLRGKKLKEQEVITNEFRFLRTIQLTLTPTSLEDGIKRIKTFIDSPFLPLDQERLNSLQQKIFDTALELCKQDTFEEQERLCIQLDGHCQQLLGEMEESPTRLSIEEIYPLVENFRDAVKTRLEKLYQTSTPQLEIRLAEEMGSYTPHDHQIEVQIVISNRNGCSPAESLEVLVQEDKNLFSLVTTTGIRLESSLRGGDRRPIIIPLKVSETAIEAQTFSLPLYIRYSTRSGETTQTEIENLSIRLYSADEFEEIDNPYAAYAEGGIVVSRDMFYGRDELIENIAKALQKSTEQSKCVVIFGQKRAGKSSTLEHLKRTLQTRPENLVLNIGNIGSIIGEEPSTPFVHQILWGILSKLRDAIEDKIAENDFPVIEKLPFPKDIEFYQHPTPIGYFSELFNNYKRAFQKRDRWREVRIVLLIDEFSYIYDQIVKGKIPETFMKNWKALLQANYFHAVLVGQDVMTKFKLRFPNEFGTTQDERVSYLREEDAQRLIDEPIRIGGRQGQSRYVERAIDRIVELTAGSPFYIQIFCNRLVEYMNQKRSKFVSDADVERIKNDLIRGVNALSLDKFDNLVNSGDTSAEALKDEDVLKVLTEVAKNSSPKSFCSRTNINGDMTVPVDDILDDLVKRDVLERRNETYRIRVDWFREWLVAHQ